MGIFPDYYLWGEILFVFLLVIIGGFALNIKATKDAAAKRDQDSESQEPRPAPARTVAKAKTVVSVKSYDELVDAIREASTLEELKRLVVPPADELEASRRRIAQLDELAPLCNFDAVYVDDETHQARDRYKRIGCAFPSI